MAEHIHEKALDRRTRGEMIHGRAGHLAQRLITIHDRERSGHGKADPLATASCLLLLMEHREHEMEVRELVCRTLDMTLTERRMTGGAFSWGKDVRTDSNGLMMAALAKAARRWQLPRYEQAAVLARIFLKTRLTDTAGKLLHRWQDQRGEGGGDLMDHACYVLGLLELYECNYSVSYLREATNIAEGMAKLLNTDEQSGRGRGVAALALLRLKNLTGREFDWQGRGALMPEDTSEEIFVDRAMTWLAAAEALFPQQLLVWSGRGEIPQWLPQLGEERSLRVLARTHDNSRGLANAAPITAQCPMPERGEALCLFRDGVMSVAHSREELDRLLTEG